MHDALPYVTAPATPHVLLWALFFLNLVNYVSAEAGIEHEKQLGPGSASTDGHPKTVVGIVTVTFDEYVYLLFRNWRGGVVGVI